MAKKERKALRNGSYSVVLSIVVIAIVILLNKMVDQIPVKYTQFDISTGKLFTIGQETKDILGKLDQNITIYYITQNGNEDSNIEKLLEQYKANSKHIKVEKKDPIVNPSFTKKYAEEGVAENSLIVECGERNKIISYENIYASSIDYTTYQQSVTGFDGEGQITSAISYVTSDSLPKVYYVEGHNEVALPTAVKERIEKTNVELVSLSLLTSDGIPEDASGLLLNAPSNDYSNDEVQKIMDYLNEGGRVMVLSDYVDRDLPNYHSILDHFGIEVVDGVVVEADQKHYVEKPYLLVPNIEYSDVTADMTNGSQYVLISGSEGYRVKDEVGESIQTKEVLTTSDRAIVKTNPKEMKSYEKEDGDQEGPFAVAVTATETLAGDDQSSSKEARVVAIASSTILEESLNNSVADGNFTLYVNALNWLVDQPDAQAVSIPSKSLEIQFLTVTAAKGILVSLIVCFVLPFACLIVGGVICLRRRRK
ncbi:MAG: GldG family protein [Eubacteriales bacterium]|nr:GldG family protein [Eubacteriales bacterium]